MVLQLFHLFHHSVRGTYQSASGTPPAICNPGDVCFMEFGGSLINGGQGCGYLNPTTVTNPGQYTGGSFSRCPVVSTTSSGPSVSESGCVLYNYGISYSNTYQNQANATYTQPLSTQYMGTGNYIICGYDYQMIDTDTSGPVYGTLSPYFATLAVNCSHGSCTAAQTLQQPAPTQPCPSCSISNTPFGVTSYNSFNAAQFGQAVCGIYGTLNAVLLIFALMLMLLGAVIYAGSSILPGQTRGVAQNYAFGFILVGIIATVIAASSIYALSVAGSTTVQGVLALCT
jgi:hypothetical protein